MDVGAVWRAPRHQKAWEAIKQHMVVAVDGQAGIGRATFIEPFENPGWAAAEARFSHVAARDGHVLPGFDGPFEGDLVPPRRHDRFTRSHLRERQT